MSNDSIVAGQVREAIKEAIVMNDSLFDFNSQPELIREFVEDATHLIMGVFDENGVTEPDNFPSI